MGRSRCPTTPLSYHLWPFLMGVWETLFRYGYSFFCDYQKVIIDQLIII
jgi:hypothetical protein